MTSPLMDDRELDRRALLDQMGSRPRGANPATGQAAPRETATAAAPPLSPPADEPETPDFSQYGQFMGSKNAALDPEKVASGHDSPKYQIARVLSHFDPRQGLTPDVLKALNGLGIGEFSSDNGQFLRVANGDPRFEGVLGADMVRNFKAGDDSTRWGGWGSVGAEGPGVKPKPTAMGAPMGGPSSFAGIQSLMPTDMSTFEQLQQRLMEILGGPQAFDRNALIAQMSR